VAYRYSTGKEKKYLKSHQGTLFLDNSGDFIKKFWLKFWLNSLIKKKSNNREDKIK